MKRFLTFTLIATMLFLAACSGNTGGNGQENSNSNANESSSDSEQGGNEPVTLTFLKPGLDQPGQRERMEKVVQEFEAANPGIKVELQGVGWGEAYQKIVTGFNTESSPDIIYGGSRWISAFAAMGGIRSLEDYAKEHIALYHDALQDAVKYNGETYAVPRAFSARALIYRSDLIEQPPETWEELVETAKKVQSEHPDMYGFAVAGAKHVSTTTQFFNYLFQNGGEVFDESGNVVINSDAGVEALQFYVDLYTKHKIVPTPMEYNREQLPVLFKEGKIAMFVCGPWAKGIMGIEADNPDTPFKTAPLPKGKEQLNTLVSDSLMVSAQTDYPDAAWTFIEFVTSPENQKKYDQEGGFLPIQKEEANDPYFSEDPYTASFVEMAKMGKAQPKPAAWEPFQDVITDAIQKAFSGTDPKTALDEAVQKIKDQQLEPK